MSTDEQRPLLGPSDSLPSDNVDWKFPEDPEHPYNWSPRRKWACAITTSFYALMGPVSSSMIVPALPSISRDLNITSEIETQMLISIFIFGWGMGPLFLAPLSEIYGRARLLNLGHALFLVANTLLVFCQNKYQFFLLRFVAGVVGSAPLALGAGVLSDLWVPSERGKSLAVYTLVPLLGPAVGAIAGGYIIQYRSWHYTFIYGSMFTATTLFFGIFILRETFSPILIRRKNLALKAPSTLTETSYGFKKFVRVDLVRPFILLFTQPLIQALALYMAYLFGLSFVAVSTFQHMWIQNYGQSSFRASLNYISIASGYVTGCQCGGPLTDKIYAYCKKRNNSDEGVPEYRVWMMFPASILVPAGQVLYGWSAEAKIHWIWPNIGMYLFSVGMIVGYQCVQAYVLDCYPVYAASAIGSLTVLRCLAGFAFPLFAPAMYNSFGYGWASTIVAGVAMVIGISSPFLLRAYGSELRKKSPYAAGYIKVTL